MNILTTNRFRLRPIEHRDQANFDFATDQEFRKYLYHRFPEHQTFVTNCVEAEDGFDLAIENKESQVIGSVHLDLEAPSYVGELACMIDREYWGQGVAFEVCDALLHHAFKTTQLHKAIAHCDARNTGSWKVLEKLGMVREGTLRANRLARDGKMVDEYCYGILRDEWPA